VAARNDRNRAGVGAHGFERDGVACRSSIPKPEDMRMAKDWPAVGVIAGSNFAVALAEALRDASASRSIGESLRSLSGWSLSKAFRCSTLRSMTNPGAIVPGLFLDA